MENMDIKYFGNTYYKKKVLITGNTGFKGSWLTLWLLELGAYVYGISKDIPTNPSLFQTLSLENKIIHKYIDINNYNDLSYNVNEIKPDFIFHLAAQPIVIESFINPINTFQTNILGTANLLDVVRINNLSTKIIIITSDKCYQNNNELWSYRESDMLGGKDPYSASKGACELVVKSYYESYFKNSNCIITTVRAGNVIGGGDWSDNRIIPDIMNSFFNKNILNLRNPNSTRPWQHVLEPLSGYLSLGFYMSKDKSLNGESFNFGPNSDELYTVSELVNSLLNFLKKESIETFQINKIAPKYDEAKFLKLNCDKALLKLNWKSVLDFDTTCQYTANWYNNYYTNSNSILEYTIGQIKDYSEKAKLKKINWSISKLV